MSFEEKLSIEIETSSDISGIKKTQAAIKQLDAQMSSVRSIFTDGLPGFKKSNRQLDKLVKQSEAMEDVLNRAGLEEGVGGATFRDPDKGSGAAGNITDQEGFERLDRELDKLNINAQDLIENPDKVLSRVDAADTLRRQVRSNLGAMDNQGIPLGDAFGREAVTRPAGDRGLQGQGLTKGSLIQRTGSGLTGFNVNMARFNELMGIGRVKMGEVVSTGGRVTGAFKNMGGSVANATSSVKSMTPSLQSLQMSLLGVQFQLLSLAFIFGGLMMSALGAVGIFEILGNTLKMFFLPIALELLNPVLNIRDALLSLDEETRKYIGRIFAIVAAFAAIGSILAFVINGFLSVISVLTGFGSAIKTVGVFLGKLLGIGGNFNALLLTMQKLTGTAFSGLTGILSFIVGILAGMVAGFMIVVKTAERFGKKVAAVVGAVLIVLGAVAAWFLSIPILVAAAVGLIIGAILGLIWTFRNELLGAAMFVFKKIIGFIGWVISAFNGFINFIVEDVIGAFVRLYDDVVGNSIIPDMIKSIFKWFGKLPGMALDFATQMVNNIIKGIKGVGSGIWNAFKSVLPDFLVDALKKGGQAVSGIVNSAGEVIGSGGKVLGDVAGGIGDAASSLGSGLSGAVGDFASGASNTVDNLNPLSGDGGGKQKNVQQNNINAQVEVNDKEETPQETGQEFGRGLSQTLNNRGSDMSSGT